jgi:hypothetical protein
MRDMGRIGHKFSQACFLRATQLGKVRVLLRRTLQTCSMVSHVFLWYKNALKGGGVSRPSLGSIDLQGTLPTSVSLGLAWDPA